MGNFLTRMKDRALHSIGVQPAWTESVGGGGGGGGKHQVVSAIKLSEAGVAAVNAVPSDPMSRYAFLAANQGKGLAPGLVGITVDQLNYYNQALAPAQIRWDNKKNSLIDRNGAPISVVSAATLCGIPTPQ